MKKLLIFLGILPPTFTHNPNDFELKIVPSWFSHDYINFSYTANGGTLVDIIKKAHY